MVESDACRYAHHLVFGSFLLRDARIMRGRFGLHLVCLGKHLLSRVLTLLHCMLHSCSMYVLRQAVYCIRTCGIRMRVKRAIL